MQNFEEIYHSYNRLVLKTAGRYCINIYDAEDIAQETFLALYEDMQKKRPEAREDYSNIKSWLSIVAKNKALNALRKDCKLILQEDMPELVGDGCLAADSAEEDYIRKEGDGKKQGFCRDIVNALKNESILQYKALFDSCYFGLTSKEISKRNHTNSACIDSRIYRARKKLRERYINDYNELKHAWANERPRSAATQRGKTTITQYT